MKVSTPVVHALLRVVDGTSSELILKQSVIEITVHSIFFSPHKS